MLQCSLYDSHGEYPLKTRFRKLDWGEGMKAKANCAVFSLTVLAVLMASSGQFVKGCIPPSIGILSPVNMIYPRDSVPLTLTLDIRTLWIGYSLDGLANVTITGNTTLSDLSDGTHGVTVYAESIYRKMGVSETVCFAVDTTPPSITNVLQDPPAESVFPEDEVKVNATVTDEVSGVKHVVLNYTMGAGMWVLVPMTSVTRRVWSATIPPFPYGTNVTYVIAAEDNVGNFVSTEEKGYVHEYPVIPEFRLMAVLSFLTTTLVAITVYEKTYDASTARAWHAR